DPVPETAAGRGVGVVAGDGEAGGVGRRPFPAEMGRHVAARHAESVVDLRLGQLLAVGHVVARDREARHLRQEVVGQRRAVGHRSLLPTSAPVGLDGRPSAYVCGMSDARRMWPAFETYHAHVYFVPEAAQAYRELGLKGGWMGYFASRSAALGPASAGLVTAVFFNFHPAMVARALPDAWALASPGEVLAARLRTVDTALRRMIPQFVGSAEEAEAAALAREA